MINDLFWVGPAGLLIPISVKSVPDLDLFSVASIELIDFGHENIYPCSDPYYIYSVKRPDFYDDLTVEELMNIKLDEQIYLVLFGTFVDNQWYLKETFW
jgi:hypothetical protein